MTANNRIVLSSDHAAIALRLAIAAHVAARGWEAVDIGPTTPESIDYPKQGEAAARLVASGDCRLGIVLCGTGQGIMMAANKVRGVRCGVCADAFSARMIRQHNDANMLAIGARTVGEGLALDIADAFLGAEFEGGRHAARVAMIGAPEGYPTHIVAVGGLVRNASGQVLLVKSPRRGWEFPGGQVEQGETLTQALMREIDEEAGVRVRVGPVAGVYTNVTPPTKVMFDFQCEWISGEPATSAESLESGWFDVETATRLVTYPAYVDRLRQLLEFTGAPLYRVYASRPYRIIEERTL